MHALFADQAACNAQCRVTDNATGQAWQTCTQNAEQGASCGRYVSTGPCLADGGLNVDVTSCNTGASESQQAYVARIGAMFCGGSVDGGPG